ncbi:hypothetical protein SAMN05444397_102463 [Flavobacterium aquidurense]|nr:hypothetical protein SAMN05444397_102463 [Flavobacterium aquidurense]
MSTLSTELPNSGSFKTIFKFSLKIRFNLLLYIFDYCDNSNNQKYSFLNFEQ